MLSLSSSGATWVKKDSKASLLFLKDLFKEALSYLMGNCYFTCGGTHFPPSYWHSHEIRPSALYGESLSISFRV